MKDKHNNEINVGDVINIAGLETEVQNLVSVYGTQMVRTDYGDFNPTMVVVIHSNQSK
jgi:hypothetical protein